MIGVTALNFKQRTGILPLCSPMRTARHARAAVCNQRAKGIDVRQKESGKATGDASNASANIFFFTGPPNQRPRAEAIALAANRTNRLWVGAEKSTDMRVRVEAAPVLRRKLHCGNLGCLAA